MRNIRINARFRNNSIYCSGSLLALSDIEAIYIANPDWRREWPRFPRERLIVADQSAGANRARFLDSRRGLGRPISGPMPRPMSERPKCARREVFLAAIRAQTGVSPDNDRLPEIVPKFEGNRGQSMCLQNGPSF